MILSDTHLANPGRGAGSAKALRPLWEGASEVILNGDVAEIADEMLRGLAARQVLELQEMAEDDGVKLTFISGNHDPLLTDRRYLRLASREVFVTHGDILHPAISPWTDHAKHLQALHAAAVLSLAPAKAREAILEKHIGSVLNAGDVAMTPEEWVSIVTTLPNVLGGLDLDLMQQDQEIGRAHRLNSSH